MQVLILIGIIIILGIAGVAYYLGRQTLSLRGVSEPRLNRGETSDVAILPTSPPTPSVSESTSSADMANWKTYTNKEYGFLFKYPSDGNFSLNSQDSLSLTNSNSNTPPYYLLDLEVKDNPQNLSARDFINNELTILRNNKNSPNSSALADKRQATIKDYQNGQITGVLMRGGSDGDSVTDFIEIVSVQKSNIYKFTIHDGNGSVSDFQNKLINQILSTFKFIP